MAQLLTSVVLVMSASTGVGQTPSMVVLDFDGETMTYVPGADADPDAGITGFSECAGSWPPFGDPVRESALVDRVQQLFADFDVMITSEPVCEGPYLRVVVGPFEGCGGGLGYAESSCERSLGQGFVFAKLASGDGRTLSEQAVVIAHEVGHAFGLAHVEDPRDIMNASVGTGDKTFLDACLPYDSTGASGDACPLVGQCPLLSPTDRQNSWLGLISMLGPAAPPESNGDCHAEMGPDPESGCGCSSRPGPGSTVLYLLLLVRLARFKT